MINTTNNATINNNTNIKEVIGMNINSKIEEAKRNADYWSNLNKAYRNKKEYYKNNTSVNNN